MDNELLSSEAIYVPRELADRLKRSNLFPSRGQSVIPTFHSQQQEGIPIVSAYPIDTINIHRYNELKRKFEADIALQKSRTNHSLYYKIDFDFDTMNELRDAYLSLNPYLPISKDIIRIFELYNEIDKVIDSYNQKHVEYANIKRQYESNKKSKEYLHAARNMTHRAAFLNPQILEFKTLLERVKGFLDTNSTDTSSIIDANEIQRIFIFPMLTTSKKDEMMDYFRPNIHDEGWRMYRALERLEHDIHRNQANDIFTYVHAETLKNIFRVFPKTPTEIGKVTIYNKQMEKIRSKWGDYRRSHAYLLHELEKKLPNTQP